MGEWKQKQGARPAAAPCSTGGEKKGASPGEVTLRWLRW